MEKKGEFFNQIAIIADLIENINFSPISRSLIFELDDDEFLRIFKLIQNKLSKNEKNPTDRFLVKIGEVDFVFVLNKSNV